MLVIMKSLCSPEEVQNVLDFIQLGGAQYRVSQGIQQGIVISVFGDDQALDTEQLSKMVGVRQVEHIQKSYRLVSREFKQEDTVVRIGGVPIGGQHIQVISGPCSVETPEQMKEAAAAVIDAGARFLRGGAFKPRTSPYSFQGHGEQGLAYLMEAGRNAGLPVVTELMDPRDIDLFLKYEVDAIQIGARNMQNFRLLQEVGKLDVPVILKRGMSATVNDFLMAAEYIAAEGNMNIILSERGIRTYENAYRNTLDISVVPFLKRETHLPVIVDPSHAGGAAWMVPALSRAAIAAGADGLLVESHPTPSLAWSDGAQSLSPAELKSLMCDLENFVRIQGKTLFFQKNHSPIQFSDSQKSTSLIAA